MRGIATVTGVASHPVAALRKAGVLAAIDPDDPPMSPTTIADGDEQIASAFSDSAAETAAICLDGIEASWAPPPAEKAGAPAASGRSPVPGSRVQLVTGPLVPIIDISGWAGGDDRARRAIADRVDAAASTVGFMQIVGHGLPDGAIDALAASMDTFFSLPADEKRAVMPPSPAINRGYTPPRTERLSHSIGIYSPDDLFEAFNIGCQASDFPDLDLPADIYAANIWPAGRDAVRRGLEGWFRLAGNVAHTMTAVFASALGLPGDFFEASTDHSIDVLRVNCYQVPEADVRLEPGQLGMGPHTDYGIVTVLWADPLPGLQILGPDGDWNDVVPSPGALLINLGDLLARWTGERWRSTMHRVLAPIDRDGRPYRRRSAAFFHDGNADAVVAPLPGAGAQFEPVTVAEHLAEKLGGSRSLALNPNAARDAARLGHRNT